jgi:hypothetical protein
MLSIEDAIKLVAERQGAPVDDKVLDKQAYTPSFTGWTEAGKFQICQIGDLAVNKWFSCRETIINGKNVQLPLIPIIDIDNGELIEVELHRFVNACCLAGEHTDFEQSVASKISGVKRKDLPAIIGGLKFYTDGSTHRLNGGKATYKLFELKE